MKINSQIINTNSSENIKLVQESVNSFREIKISNLEDRFFSLFAQNEIKLRTAKTNVRILSDIPRYIIETTIISTIVILSLILNLISDGNNYSIFISSLGTFLYGSQRLLPLAQNTYRSFSTIRSSTFSIRDIIEYLELKKIKDSKNSTLIKSLDNINFNQTIELKSVSFNYPKSNKFIVKNFNLKINKGELICLLGTSGSGKSTLMDIIMGLIKPTKGRVLIDGKDLNNNNRFSWRNKLAHVPQEILLLDDTIKNNIAFGLLDDEIDERKLKIAINISSLDKVINNMKNGINTVVGERGALLSGGQKQRIGIARAIYQNKEILLLDEATSALDKKNEENILKNILKMENIYTVIMITHRPRNVIKYDKVININSD